MPAVPQSPGSSSVYYQDHDHDSVPSSGQHGVGIIFEHTDPKDGGEVMVVVKQIVSYGSADRTQSLKVGDYILAVDGDDVKRRTIEELKQRIMGGSGTTVAIKIKRGSSDQVFQIPRGKAGYWALVDELEALKQQVGSSQNGATKAEMDQANSEQDKLLRELEEWKKRCQEALDAKNKAEQALKGKADDADRAKSDFAQLETKIKALHDSIKDAEERARAAEIEAQRAVKEAAAEAKLRAQAEEREAKAQAALLEEVHLRKEFQNDNAVLTARLAEAAEKIKPLPEYVSRNIALEAQVAELQSSASNSETEAGARKQLLARLQEDFKNLKAAHAVLENKAAGLEAELSRAQAEEKRVKGELKTLQERYVAATGELEQALSDCRMAQQECKNAKKMLGEVEASHGHAQSGVQEQKAVLEQERAERLSLESMLKAASDRKMALIQEMSELRDKMRQLEVQNDSLTLKNKDLDAQLASLPELKAKILQLQVDKRNQDDLLEELKAENNRLKGSEGRLRGELEAAVASIEALLSQINALKLADAHKLADMERRINEDVYFLTQERDNYKMELDRYYGLPNPCGVGMLLEEMVTIHPTGGSTKEIGVKKLIEGMAAHLSGVIQLGDDILEIDGITCLGMTLDEMKAKIAGPRGSRVTLKMKHPDTEKTYGKEYTISLKRGAWGPEHCVVAPEDKDFVDQGRWPAPGALSTAEFNIADIDRHNVQSLPPPQQQQA